MFRYTPKTLTLGGRFWRKKGFFVIFDVFWHFWHSWPQNMALLSKKTPNLPKCPKPQFCIVFLTPFFTNLPKCLVYSISFSWNWWFQCRVVANYLLMISETFGSSDNWIISAWADLRWHRIGSIRTFHFLRRLLKMAINSRTDKTSNSRPQYKTTTISFFF